MKPSFLIKLLAASQLGIPIKRLNHLTNKCLTEIRLPHDAAASISENDSIDEVATIWEETLQNKNASLDENASLNEESSVKETR